MMVLVERDRQILEFMANWAFVVSEQVQEYMGMSAQMSWRRLARLTELGLVTYSKTLNFPRKFYFVSREGLEYLGFSAENSPKGVKLAQLEHDKTLIDIAIDFHRRNPEYEIFGETKMRRLDMSALAHDDAAIFSLNRFVGGRSVQVFPDMVAKKDSAMFYIEYEHSPKDRKRLHSLMTGYANSPKVTAVKYYVAPAAWVRVSDVYDSLKNDLPLVGGKPKIQVELYEGGK